MHCKIMKCSPNLAFMDWAIGRVTAQCLLKLCPLYRQLQADPIIQAAYFEDV